MEPLFGSQIPWSSTSLSPRIRPIFFSGRWKTYFPPVYCGNERLPDQGTWALCGLPNADLVSGQRSCAVLRRSRPAPHNLLQKRNKLKYPKGIFCSMTLQIRRSLRGQSQKLRCQRIAKGRRGSRGVFFQWEYKILCQSMEFHVLWCTLKCGVVSRAYVSMYTLYRNKECKLKRNVVSWVWRTLMDGKSLYECRFPLYYSTI